MTFFLNNHIHFESLSSTNKFALSIRDKAIFREGLLITADYQKYGQGQRGNLWESNKKENILLSYIIEPKILVKYKFDICKYISLALFDLLSSVGINANIKWPNDLLIGDRKIAGILINNVISKNIITHSVIGIGLNVNQKIFKQYCPKATSINLELGVFQDCEIIRDNLLHKIIERIIQYNLENTQDLEYHNALFSLNKTNNFRLNEKVCKGIIRGVNKEGNIEIEFDGKISTFYSGELKYIF